MASTVAASIGVLGVWTLINLRRIDEIGWINNAAAIFQLSASFVMLVVLLGATTQYAALDFFTQPSANVSASTSAAASPAALKVLTALLCALFGLSGYDSGSQTAAETQARPENPPLTALSDILPKFTIFQISEFQTLALK
jgi:amino acid transporter